MQALNAFSEPVCSSVCAVNGTGTGTGKVIALECRTPAIRNEVLHAVASGTGTRSGRHFPEGRPTMLSRPGKLSDPLAIAAGFAVLFGVLTILSGGTALFSSEDIRSNFGDVVQTVLWFNFVSGFWYVLTGLGLWARRYWAVQSSVLLLLAILAVFAYLGVHILDGGAFEMRTVVAMTFRAFCWSLISMMAVKLIPHR